ncbi:MAG: hypothetical protein KDC24_07545 [Saprospiraceae bacterium]|nr:hypothetical protein [Saprospiraceae bacterium]
MYEKVLLWSFIIFLAAACQFERQFEEVHDMAEYESFQQLSKTHQLNLLRLGEAGQSLDLCLRLTDGKTGQPLKRKGVVVYQANAKGDYLWEIPGDKSTAKLRGQLLTDEEGRIFLKTLLPGDFGSTFNNRTIHLKVEGTNPDQLNLYFRQYANADLQKEIQKAPDKFLINLEQDARSNLIGVQNLVIGKGTQKNIATTTLPSCEWCGCNEAPEDIGYTTTIAPFGEPGTPLELSGTVYLEDGITPASDVIIYAYHTNAKGLYAKKGDETGNGLRHGYLRGWVKTNEQGQYKFRTIKPAPYPTREEPAHIHMTLKAPGYPEYWIQSTLFKGDPLISPEDYDILETNPHIIEFTKGEDGILRGKRDIIISQPKS